MSFVCEIDLRLGTQTLLDEKQWKYFWIYQLFSMTVI